MNNNTMEYQWREEIDLKIIRIPIGIDGINLSLIMLLGVLYPIIYWIVDNNRIYNKLNISYTILLIIFLSIDIFIFFFFFELILIPFFLLIGIYGSENKRIEAAYRFILYTLIGSLLMIIGIIYIDIIYGSTNIEYIIYKYNPLNTNNHYLWILFSLSFLIKLPIFPFHIWLPVVHVESPTIGSILLAGILLKLGTYGLVRYNIPIFNYNNSYYIPILLILILLSIYYSSIININQIDLKKIIAYSSIIHMNFSLYGIFSNDINGLYGALYSNISHGIVSSALFYLIGILYIRYHSRIITYYSGLLSIMPIYSIFLLLFIFHNMALPLSSSFISEFYLLFSSYKFNIFFSILLSFSLLFSTIYNIWLVSRLIYSTPIYIHLSLDLSYNEFLSLSTLLFFSFLLGIFPSPLLSLFSPYILPILY